jgi:hypothetical protein
MAGTKKYMGLRSFRKEILASKPDLTIEQDYFDWELAVTGIADMQEEIKRLKALRKNAAPDLPATLGMERGASISSPHWLEQTLASLRYASIFLLICLSKSTETIGIKPRIWR